MGSGMVMSTQRPLSTSGSTEALLASNPQTVQDRMRIVNLNTVRPLTSSPRESGMNVWRDPGESPLGLADCPQGAGRVGSPTDTRVGSQVGTLPSRLVPDVVVEDH